MANISRHQQRWLLLKIVWFAYRVQTAI